MPLPDLDDTEKSALTDLLRQPIAADRYPLSPRIRTLRAILDKLAPQPAPAVVYPAPKPPGEPSMALRKKRRR